MNPPRRSRESHERELQGQVVPDISSIMESTTFSLHRLGVALRANLVSPPCLDEVAELLEEMQGALDILWRCLGLPRVRHVHGQYAFDDSFVLQNDLPRVAFVEGFTVELEVSAHLGAQAALSSHASPRVSRGLASAILRPSAGPRSSPY